jgi:transposase-like protein
MSKQEKENRKLSGKGHVGTFCPRCEGELEFIDTETYSEEYFEYYKCRDCGAKFSVKYEPVEWREE